MSAWVDGRRDGRGQRPAPRDIVLRRPAVPVLARRRRRPTTGPAPLVDTPYPVVVLTSTTDPATPIANGMRIFSRLDDAYFFQAVGGPHVIYAWGEACPDDPVTAFITDGTPPSTRVTTCAGEVADTYVPNAALAKADYKDALDLMTSVDDQIFNSDDYAYRLDDEPDLRSAATTADRSPTRRPTAGTSMTLTACEFTPDVPLTGTGESDDNAGTFKLDVTIGTDQLEYERDADGNTKVKGTYNGKKVDQTSNGLTDRRDMEDRLVADGGFVRIETIGRTTGTQRAVTVGLRRGCRRQSDRGG